MDHEPVLRGVTHARRGTFCAPMRGMEINPHPAEVPVIVGAGGDEETAIYWHRRLPPLDAELMAEHTVEATSNRVPGTLSHRDELWDRCYQELMSNANARLSQEIARLGGDYAHVHDESIESHHDDAAGEAWLRGRFSYMLYRRPSQPAKEIS